MLTGSPTKLWRPIDQPPKAGSCRSSNRPLRVAAQAVVIIGVSLQWLASPLTTFERRGSRQRRVRGSWGYPPDRACST